MSRRLWITTLLLAVTLAAIIALSIIAFFESAIPLFVIVLVFTALAVVAFNYLVVNPYLLENAKKQARNLCSTGEIVDPMLHEKICNRLAVAPNDVEASALHKKMREIQGNRDRTG